jgi:FKBP-type peptidyl-prolyl cis-trans isomerase
MGNKDIKYITILLVEMSRRDVSVEIFAAGDGINYPRPGNVVTIHYTGFLTDGSRFDSSRDRGKPFKFKLGAEQVIPGLDLGVAQLSIGERAKLKIPSHLAYGDKGFPGLIPGKSELIFDIELITFS